MSDVSVSWSAVIDDQLIENTDTNPDLQSPMNSSYSRE